MVKLFLLTLVFVAPITANGQAFKTSEILIPSDASIAEAESLNARAFKLILRHKFESLNDSSKDEDNPLGVRGGGAFYSFSTGSHSYNKIPQILFERSGDMFVFGFYGDNFGLAREIRHVSLSAVSPADPDVSFLSNYNPPRISAEIREEHRRLQNISRETGFDYRAIRSVAIGKTYVLRTISFNEADILVAFQLLRRLPDGSIELAWRQLKEYPTPRLSDLTDEELRVKVQTILSEKDLAGISGEVTENEIIFRGKIDNRIENYLRSKLYPLKGVIRFVNTEK